MGRTVSAPASRASWTCRVASACQPRRPTDPARTRRRQPQPAHVVLAAAIASLQNVCSARLQRRPRRRRSLGEPHRQAIEEQVDRPWRLRCRRCAAGCLGGLAQPDARAEAAGEHRRSDRFEVGLTRQPRRRAARAVWRRSSSSGGASLPRARGERDLGAQPLQPCALELVERAELGRPPAARSAASGAPASNLAWAAASARAARRAGSGVSSAARSRNAAAAG